MRIIKLGIISFVVFFGILTLISLFIPSRIRMSKVISIQAEKDSIVHLLRNKDQWPRWHPAFIPATDPGRKDLQQTRVVVIGQTDSTLQVELTRPGRKPLRTGWAFHKAASTEPVTVVWFTDFHLSWTPWQKFSSLFLENTHGALMEQGLSHLKKEAEKNWK